MALSEHEQRMLDQIEQALLADDPKFASSVNPARIRRRRPMLSALLLVLGVVALVVGVIATQQSLLLGVTISVVGFVLMVAAAGLLVYGQPGAKAAQTPVRAAGVSSPLSTRMEERFRRRFEE